MASPPLISLRDVGFGHGATPLFDGVDLSLSAGDRLCLVGRNGSGKSTLLACLLGRIVPDTGTRTLQPGLRLAGLSQSFRSAAFPTLRQAIMDQLPATWRGDDYRADAALEPFGLHPDTATRGLSGGELRRADLAACLAREPDVLILDEPTNHLDLPTILWLEGWLEKFRGGLLVVSHDRAFLEAVTARTAWLDRGVLRQNPSGFSHFADWQERVWAAEEADYAARRSKLRREMDWLHHGGVTARRRRNQGRLRRLQDLRASLRNPQSGRRLTRLDLQAEESGGSLVIEATGLGRQVGEGPPRTLFRDLDLRLRRRDRLAIIGPNGAGKTTLVRLLVGLDTPRQGAVRQGTGLRLTYFDQGGFSLQGIRSVRQALLPDGGDMVAIETASGTSQQHISGYLKDFLFDPGRADAPIGSLSGGERARLSLARLFTRRTNLLVLDEPTNDLDIETQELLEDLLDDYPGTVILISHDRRFIDRLVTKTLILDGAGNAHLRVGGYSDADAAGDTFVNAPRPTPKPQRPPPAQNKGSMPRASRRRPRLSYGEQRERHMLPDRISELTARKVAIERELANPDLYAGSPHRYATLSEELSAAGEALTAVEDRWLELEERAEALDREQTPN